MQISCQTHLARLHRLLIEETKVRRWIVTTYTTESSETSDVFIRNAF